MARRFVFVDDWEDVRRPKQEIGDYVASYGFKVPHRYESFEGAMHDVRAGKTVLMRSEHPQEYDGFSGLLSTYRITSERLHNDYHPLEAPVYKCIYQNQTFEDIEHAAKSFDIRQLHTKRYLDLTHQDHDDFFDAMSYSFWEHIPGKNIMVVADDSIAERYHITAKSSASSGGGMYKPDGEELAGPAKQYPNHEDILDPATRATLIETYEQIRTLPRFCAQICPIMELQLQDDGTVWFLQYHKGRPFRAAPEYLAADDYPEAEGWRPVEAVRGALGSLVTLQTALYYPRFGSTYDYVPQGPEDASFDFHNDIGLSEYAARTRVANLSAQGLQRHYLDMADGAHVRRSSWFKPFGALALGGEQYDALVPQNLIDGVAQLIREKRMAGLVVDVASDGRRGFIRLNPDSEQPRVVNN